MKFLGVRNAFFALQLLVVVSFIPFIAAELIGLIALSVLLGYFGVLKGKLLKLAATVIFLSGLALIRIRFGSLAGVDVSVAFLLLCLGVKLMEVKLRRDYYVVFCVDLFVLGGVFLLSQSLTSTLWVFLLILLILGLMVRVNLRFPKNTQLIIDASANQGVKVGFKSLGLLVGLAVPLLVALFLFFPRLPPLWSVPVAGSQGQTGLSDTISPGDIADLSQSAELSFRAFFPANQTPPLAQMYFRALVMSRFDGVAWSQTDYERYDSGYSIRDFNQNRRPDWLTSDLTQSMIDDWLSYEVAIEPNQRNYVFALDVPMPNQTEVRVTEQRVLRSDRPIATRTRFKLYRAGSVDAGVLSQESIDFYTTLPAGNNPQTRQLAVDLYNQSGRDPERFVNMVLARFREQPYFYTLKPQMLQGERIDQFMFETREGFCEHYASAFAFMMRAAGVPARMVAGYMGGERSDVDGSWEVRQLDAHAWTEVWIGGQWRRVDPTAAVAPERVEQGMEGFLDASGSRSFGEGALAGAAYQQYRWLSDMRRYTDEISYRFERDIVGYDAEDQKNGIFKSLGIRSLAQQIGMIVVIFTAVVLLFYAWLWFKARPTKGDPLDELMISLSGKLKPLSADRMSGEGVIAWLERIGFDGPSESAHELARVYRRGRYAERIDTGALRRAQKLAVQVRREIKNSTKDQ